MLRDTPTHSEPGLPVAQLEYPACVRISLGTQYQPEKNDTPFKWALSRYLATL